MKKTILLILFAISFATNWVQAQTIPASELDNYIISSLIPITSNDEINEEDWYVVMYTTQSTSTLYGYMYESEDPKSSFVRFFTYPVENKPAKAFKNALMRFDSKRHVITISNKMFYYNASGSTSPQFLDNPSSPNVFGVGSPRSIKKVELTPIVADGIALSENFKTISLGTSFNLNASVYPLNTATKTVEWSSSDPTIASVNNGYVRGLKEGQVTITAATTDGSELSSSCLVTVNPILATDVSLDLTKYEISVGATGQAFATIYPSTVSDRSLIWGSMSENIVSIDPVTGEFTGLSAGTALIYATTCDGSELTAKALVNVSEVANYDFSKPNKLTPALDAPEDEDSYISYKEIELTDGQSTVCIDMGSRTGTYSFRVYSDEDLRYYLKCYTNGTITISAKDDNFLSKITFTGSLIDLTPSTGTIIDGVWTGNAQSVTFNIEAANSFNSISLEYAPKSSVSLEDDVDLTGDLNKDKRVNIADVTTLVEIILKRN